MRILHTNMLRGWGGQSNRILVEALGAQRAGHQVALVVPEVSVLAQKGREAGMEVFPGYEIRPPIRLWNFLPDLLRLRRDLQRWRPDVIHVHGSPDTWLIAAADALLGAVACPVLRTKHHTFPIRNSAANRWIYARMDAFVSISEFIDKQLADFPAAAARPRALIHSVPDSERFRLEQPGTLRAELLGATLQSAAPAAHPPFVWISTGRLRTEKGFDILLDAFAKLRAALPAGAPAPHLAIAGDGSLRPELEERARRLGLLDPPAPAASAVTFLGFRKDVPQLLASADAYVLASRMEGLGTAILEALSAGMPVVATRVGGIPDSVKHERTGLLVESENPDALAAAMARLMGDAALRARLGAAARAYIDEAFTESALVAKTLAFYEQVIARGKSRR